MGKSGLHLQDYEEEGKWNPVIGEPNGSLPVTIQDQTTPTFYLRAMIESAQFVLASDTVVGEYTFTALNTHGITTVLAGTVLNNYIEFFNNTRWIQAKVLSITVDTPVAGTDTITIDQPFDYVYEVASTICYSGDIDLNKDGSGTPIIARMSNKHLVFDFDITRINIYLEDTTVMDLSQFGNIAALARGLQWRFHSVNGDWSYFNGYNAKTNGELTEILSFWEFVDKSGGGLFSFVGHKVFGGQDNLGVVIRLVVADQDTMEVLIQDKLDTIGHIHVHYEGSIVQ